MTLLAAIVLAHSWYPQGCCGGHDCAPVPCDQVIETKDGYRVGSLLFTDPQVSPSRDAECHACVHDGIPLCLFIQPTS